ncbi:glycine--tRNA ligase subunit beta [Priestia taiwanensis]|uniref:Glycine--tRNA ligase beta subunit n=1 Tax=Priestia taiwanensis TaxID=1347902 RepID=A0A917ATX6_9BACI|nr:glycine--tRNA ligase subunit beta [Priestia taiwanensis]MBM7363756.1 glycyl-tRNA synthetase beta chain [Priestia taiwanensis]GGE74402.1 glycine--tRNA ligase beta subunit [Priestia taiwanensis]
MRDLLLEIGLEEMPARFVTDSMNQLQTKVAAWLDENRISYETVTAYSTPRRLAVKVTGVAEKQEDIQEEAKGPAKKIALDAEGNWSKAAQGFVRGQGGTVEDIFFKEIKGVEYVHVNKFVAGKETVALLPTLQEVVVGLHFGKNMRWGHNDLRFVRPVKWIIALFGTEIIPMAITNVTSSNTSRGHRFLGEEVTITDANMYEKALEEQFVIVNPETRKNMIREQLKALEAKQNWTIPVDEELLEEVNNLVEYPTAFFGSFEKEFLEVPAEVLITSMKEHQRYFPVMDTEGNLLAHFVAVRNGDDKHLDNVARGNEKVLRARLSDAAFFYREDQKVAIADRTKKLDSIVFHEELGTIGDKVRRVGETSAKLVEKLQFDAAIATKVARTVEICKFDLVTHMVYEFPELQGLMGEKYARIFGEDEEVAVAINEHYMPRSADDATPASDIGAIVSISDKLDTIVGSFSIGLIPSGSQDPYALRRQASGVVNILLAKEWTLSLETLLSNVIDVFEAKGLLKRSRQEVLEDLYSFFKLRLKNVLNEKGVSYDIVEAMLETVVGDVNTFVARAVTLEANRTNEGFKGAVESLSRVCNIAKKGELVQLDESLFEVEEEKVLFSAYESMKKEYFVLYEQGNIEAAFEKLATLSPVIDAYFDKVMVMADDEKVRNNRLSQMVHLAHVIQTFTNFNTIIVK